MIDPGLNVQAAGDAARFRHDQEPDRTKMEAKLYDLVGPQLSRSATRCAAPTAR